MQSPGRSTTARRTGTGPGPRTGDGERAISGNRQASWAFADAFVAEDDALVRARARSHAEGLRPVSPGTGAALRLLAAAGGAKAAVEIGTGAGVSGIHLLRGMRRDGVLTTVDTEPDRQQLAREAYREAGFAANRSRFICGSALDVLPRLTDGGYDLVFCDADRREYLDYLDEAMRLLRPGGVVCFEGAFGRGRALDAAHHDDEALRLRELMRVVRDSPHLAPVLLPTDDGLLCAVRALGT
ncbi:O-methyltransferase [Streptomyces sp. PLK6-54]|uniref:O-methyltransferase n=1 Tax=Actinacidiphila acidipaludis TaxID=2873382 RepID=A0ABS7Q215_9ACTN|nr:O-methyltransferase [Streptomyces acidipaludis]